MRIKILLLTFVSGITALVLAQNSPSGAVPPASGNVPGSPTVTAPNVTTNPTNGMDGITNQAPMTNSVGK